MLSEPINSYRDLKVWQDAMSLAESCYLLTKEFPREEMFGMTSQIRRAASSIPANIAEGHGREGTRTFIQYLRIAQGSLKEVETHLLLAARVKLISQQRIEAVLDGYQHLGRMLRALIRRLEKKVD
ncbi:MAG: four helix bundle protein [Rhizomicrobium sp.]|jgi:four helix bundle protein